MSWAVSQAAPLRRVNITGNLDLTGVGGSLAFGSEIADSRIAGTVSSGNALAGEPAQAQYYTPRQQYRRLGRHRRQPGVLGRQRRPRKRFRPERLHHPAQHTGVASSTVPLPRARQVPGVRPLRGHPHGRRQLVHRPPGRAEPGNRPVLHRQAHRHRRSDQPSPCRREEPPPDAGRLRPGGTHPGHPTEHRGPGPGLRHLDADPGHSRATDPRRTRSRGVRTGCRRRHDPVGNPRSCRPSPASTRTAATRTTRPR